MIPTIFELGPIPLHSFGLMMVLAFLSGWRLLWLILREHGEDASQAEQLVFWAAIGGIVGARLNYVLSFPEEFFAHPLGALLGGAGFVFFGGLLGGTLAVAIKLRLIRKPFLDYADLVSPVLALGYAVGRIGCHLSGDGDYGIPTAMPWAVSYVLGVVPTKVGELVHPTPVYETLSGLALTALLLFLLRRGFFPRRGQLFGLYLILSSLSRFLVEFIRIEPRVAYGLTQAQLVSVAAFVVGAPLWLGWFSTKLRTKVQTRSAKPQA